MLETRCQVPDGQPGDLCNTCIQCEVPLTMSMLLLLLWLDLAGCCFKALPPKP